MTRNVRRQLTCAAVVSLLATPLAFLSAQRASSVPVDPDDIAGVVTSGKGPEAGVWVVAETTDLPTKYAKVVVTDDQGRYLVPDLPRGDYQVFVRGYGLVDSPRVTAKPGQTLDLKAVVAPDAKAAAQYYPANYWLSMMDNNDTKNVRHCGTACHQVGNKATREIPKELGSFPSAVEAWDHRVRVGPVGGMMAASFMRLGEDRKAFAAWTDAIAAGALPKEVPPRPTGIERNAVLTLWDWATPVSFLHDEIAGVHYDPKLLPNSRIWGVSNSNDFLAWMDPVEHKAGQMPIPTGTAKPGLTKGQPSAYWGGEDIWQPKGQPRSAALDASGRVWYASAHRGTLSGFGGGNGRGDSTQPAFCMESSNNRFAKFYPLPRPSGKQVGYYDPRTDKFGMVDTCFTTDHNHLREDGKLFFGNAEVIGWVDIPAWDKTQDHERSQGWLPGVIDNNGDGKITKPWTEPDQPSDPAKDRRVRLGNGCYQPSVSPTDGSVWCSGDTLTRIELGANPPETTRAEIYNSPLKGGHGINIDNNGVVWANYNGRGPGSENAVLASFDRRKCKVNSSKGMTGNECPEGWTVYKKRDQKADESDHFYLTYMDAEDVLGIGVKNVPYAGGANSDSVVGLNPQTGKYFTLRLPYPMGYFPRSMQPRIDDAKAGWKGRGLWTNYATYAPWLVEGGKGVKPKVVKLQL
ncbi:MAG: carboxypeptidase-like regulatory domain-containing protein, partial [Vicinamibacterales bacterium]